jgi:hypothetical protein
LRVPRVMKTVLHKVVKALPPVLAENLTRFDQCRVDLPDYEYL